MSKVSAEVFVKSVQRHAETFQPCSDSLMRDDSNDEKKRSLDKEKRNVKTLARSPSFV